MINKNYQFICKLNIIAWSKSQEKVFLVKDLLKHKPVKNYTLRT